MLTFSNAAVSPTGDTLYFYNEPDGSSGNIQLQEGTTYTASAWAVAADGNTYPIEDVTFTTDETLKLTTPNINDTIVQENYIEIDLDYISGADSYHFAIYNDDTNTDEGEFVSSTSDESFTVNSDTEYTFYI